MALNNCTINSQSFQKEAGSAIGSDNSQLVIVPNDGYTVSASNFQNNTGSVTGVSSISLTDSGTPGTLSNTVLVNIDLDDNYVMPSANTDITIDIDGSADLISYSISGTYNTTVSNTTSSNESNITYSDSGNENQQVTLFTKTFTASAGYYFLTAPSYVLNVSSSSKYTITHVDTTDSEDRITARAFTVKYTFTNESESGDVINFIANAAEIFVPTVEITAYKIIKTNIDPVGATRAMNIYGAEGAEFSLSVVNEDTTSIVSITDAVIPSSGLYKVNIVFPSVTDSDQYDFVLTGDLSSAFDTVSGQDSTFSIPQALNIDVAIGLTHSDSDVSISANVSTNLLPDSTIDTDDAVLDNNFTISVISPNELNIDDNSVTLSEFTNTDFTLNGGTDIFIGSLEFTTVSSTEITASLEAGVGFSGVEDVTSLLNLDSYISVTSASVSYDSVVTVDDCLDGNGIATTITPISESNIIVGATIQTVGAGSYRFSNGLTNGQLYDLSAIINTSYLVTTDSSGEILSINQCQI